MIKLQYVVKCDKCCIETRISGVPPEPDATYGIEVYGLSMSEDGRHFCSSCTGKFMEDEFSANLYKIKDYKKVKELYERRKAFEEKIGETYSR